MSLPVLIRPEALQDIRSIYDELEHLLSGLGDKFKARLHEVLEHIEANPDLYGVVWEDVRAVRLRRFQYVLYYVVFADRAEVLAVIHGSRDDLAWHSRVE